MTDPGAPRQGRLEDEIRFGGVARDPPGQIDRDGFLPASSPLRRITSPSVISFAGGRAILMELAHPAIARAVADFDHFQRDPTRRAQLTALAMVRAIHGTSAVAHGVGEHLRAVHARISGPGYRASDPSLVLWVHATFVDSLLELSRPLGRRLTPAERDEAYAHAVLLGELFGVPASEQPASLPAFDAYIASTAASLSLSDDGRSLARQVFYPSLPRSRRPLAALYRGVCFGTLPDPLRTAYRDVGPTTPPWWLRTGRTVSPPAARAADQVVRRLNRRGVTLSGILAGVGIRPVDPASASGPS